ncbi:DapH/DapD/GlmU-related protein [Paenibacillus sp. R14(2021)]|uniref:DapH/DapD/GlmU-related protein n=1 Tax=Paenibacillus sp. R14(2021) TaxID=2859228 RepID=UPI001C613049|nr:DapH/DapD/GlmU-related protein [Paenibacillus sp. R14(2021)]
MITKLVQRIRWKLRGEVPTEHLINMGLKVGKNFNRRPECIIDYSHCFLITIGDDVTLAPRVHIIAHDASTKTHLNYTKIGLIHIGDRVFVGAGSIILPNVKIGNDVIIAAGSIVAKDIPDNSLFVGNAVVDTAANYLEKNRKRMSESPTFDQTWTVTGNITSEQKEIMIEKLRAGIGFVE